MLFNSVPFAVFFAIVFALHSLPFPWRLKKINLLAASYIFYAAWNPPFVILLWISTIVDWLLAKALYTVKSQAKRKLVLCASLALNLGLLGFFKYGQFILDNISWLTHADLHSHFARILLPVGISFYTFQSLSYTLDVYFRKTAPEKSLLDYALYIGFFPQLVAGPIVRSHQFLPQTKAPRQATYGQFHWGLRIFLIGLFQKMVVADFIMAPVVQKVFAPSHLPGFTEAWLGTLAFSWQIFCDFAGYSLCATGAALCLGFYLPRNFRCPYAAVGFSDFWKRWHISLSRWLRDYLYIPLGGNRKGEPRAYFNLLITMLIGGLWHGASWTFVIWGGLHGIYLCAERTAKKFLPQDSFLDSPTLKFFYGVVTYFFIALAWVFFRAKTFSQARAILASMLGFHGFARLETVSLLQAKLVIFTSLILFMIHVASRNATLKRVVVRIPWWGRGIAIASMILAIWLTAETGRPFIYFQF